MTSQRISLLGLLVTCSFFESTVVAADTPPLPTVAQTMAFKPIQSDVDYEIPKPAEYAKCKVDKEIQGKVRGYVVLNPTGQVLRKFLDTDGDDQYDQFRYYNLGIEVYRDIDTNQNKKIDQFRWLNRGGTRWGIDKNEDGHIDQWKVLSAAEASREAIRAMVSGDAAALRAVMINAEDLKLLGVNPQLTAKLLESASDAEKKAKAVLKNSKIITPQSFWTRFDAQLPGVIPADEKKAEIDLQFYESAYAIIAPDEKNNKKSDAVQIGEMIRVGEVWKLTQVPLPIEKESTTTNPILMEPSVPGAGPDTGAPGPSAKVTQILKDLQEIEQKVLQPNLSAAQIKALMSKRGGLVKEAMDLAETEDEKTILTKQNIDGLALAAQVGDFADGVSELKEIEAEIAKKAPDSPLLPYAIYRRLQAEYSVNAKAGGNQAQVQKDHLEALEEFVNKYPNSDDAGEALINLGIQEELQGQTKEATAWYQRLVKEKTKSEHVLLAQGALRRLNLKDQPLVLEGPLLTGQSLDIRKLKGQVVLVVFWNSSFKTCEEDIPQLRAIYRDYKPKGFEIVGVALDSDKAVVQSYVKKHEMSWQQIFQPGTNNQFGGITSPIASNYGIISFPTMFLVNKDGKVLSRNANITEIKMELPKLLNPEEKKK